MTIAELIVELQKLPPDRRVLVDGYECGFNTPGIEPEERVHHCPNHESYEGEWDYASDEDQPGEVQIATILHR